MKQISLIGFCMLAFCLYFPTGATAEIKTEEVKYTVGGEEFTGYIAYDGAVSKKRPGVLVVHEWWGHNPYVRKRAEMLAKEGYTAFALDMYGTGKLADHPNDAKAFMQATLSNLSGAEARFDKALEILREHETTDPEKTAAIGYCFGGGVVLHAARRGLDLDGVASFHGSLGAKAKAAPGAVKAKIRVFTGEADPFVSADAVVQFTKEMTDAGADFKVKSYPGVKHSFTNPDADKFASKFNMPLGYNKDADTDSWAEMLAFFKSLFAAQ